jgi:hypothetical protein
MSDFPSRQAFWFWSWVILLAAVGVVTRGATAAEAQAPAVAPAPQTKQGVAPLMRTVDIDLGRSQQVELADGRRVAVKLLELKESRDSVRNAVREARVLVDVDGQPIWLTSANYQLPQTVAGVQIDCPVTRGYVANSSILG